MGASIFVSANRNLQKAVREFGLELDAYGGEDGRTAVWDGERWVYEEKGAFGWGWWSKVKAVWRCVLLSRSPPEQAHLLTLFFEQVRPQPVQGPLARQEHRRQLPAPVLGRLRLAGRVRLARQLLRRDAPRRPGVALRRRVLDALGRRRALHRRAHLGGDAGQLRLARHPDPRRRRARLARRDGRDVGPWRQPAHLRGVCRQERCAAAPRRDRSGPVDPQARRGQGQAGAVGRQDGVGRRGRDL